MVSNKDAVAPTIIRYYIGGNVNKTNVRIIDKFWITANCNQILRKKFHQHSNHPIVLTQENQEEIRSKALVSRDKNISYIHKFNDHKDGIFKFCRAELKKK